MNLLIILKAFYSVMVITVLSLMWFYVRGLTSAQRVPLRAKASFYGWIGFLTVAAVLFHLLTIWKLPWVHWEIKRNEIKPEQEIVIGISKNQFFLPDDSIRIVEGQVVKFTVKSEDLTYGFGVFRENGTMVFQMQAIPGHSNEIIWIFSEPGKYSIRSTEYAGPESWRMAMKNAIEVSSDDVELLAEKVEKAKRPHL